eukprot:m.103681 g.103681  ORF g.103681 m.103681 type:complete len:303 (-) comp15588_c0_seq3:83-991(-)
MIAARNIQDTAKAFLWPCLLAQRQLFGATTAVRQQRNIEQGLAVSLLSHRTPRHIADACAAPGSYRPSGAGAYNVSLLVEDMVDLITVLKAREPSIKKVHVVAHDWGGPVAWTLAGWHGPLLSTLTILNGPHPSVFRRLLLEDDEQRRRSSYILLFDSPQLVAAAGLDKPAGINKLFAGDAWYDIVTEAAMMTAWSQPDEINAGLSWYRDNICGGCTVASGGFTQKAFEKSNMATNLTIDVETLVLWGMADTAFDNDQNLALLPEFVPNLKVEKFPSNSHWLAQENATGVSNAVVPLICQSS